MTSATRRQAWTDWTGFTACLAMGLWLAYTAGSLSLLLLPALLKELICAAAFLTRRRVIRSARGLTPQVVAFGHGYIIFLFSLLAAQWFPKWVAPTQDPRLLTVGAVLWLFGALTVLTPLVFLRRSFSIVPAARALVTSGPYGFARHPIYSAYLFMFGGILLQHFTLPFAIIMAVWFWLMVVRIRYEEAVLTEAFPEYSEYRARVGAFGPRLGHVVQELRSNTAPAR